MEKRNALSKFPLLTVDGVTKRFGGVTALEGLSFSIDHGKIFGLIGPNGAGKTTLFNCITGLAYPDKGSIYFGDSQTLLNRLYPYEISAKGIARTFQTIRLFNNMTALENVMVGAHSKTRMNLIDAFIQPRWIRVEEKKLRANAMKLLDFFGLGVKAGELAKNLSYGHQRKLEIARALASEPKLLLLDEPAAGMNPKEKDELLSLVRAIRGRGIAILLIDHDMKFVMPVSEHVMVLDYGRRLAAGKPRDVQNNPAVIEAYLGRKTEDRRQKTEGREQNKHA